MQVTCHPRLGDALEEGGGHRNQDPQFLYVTILFQQLGNRCHVDLFTGIGLRERQAVSQDLEIHRRSHLIEKTHARTCPCV